jgi:predicted amidohydrolase YtcJ
MTRLLLGAAWLLVAALPAFAAESADLVLRRAQVMTMSEPGGAATAVAIRGDRIVYVGDETGIESWVGSATRVIDASGCTVTPGLVDTHGHLKNLGLLLIEPNLVGTRSIDDVVSRVRAYQKEIPAGEWIHGRGWDQNDWNTQSFPTWRDLESTGENPVYLDRIDGHALWVNRTAMERAGITRDTPDPPGGRIVREKNGEPTGIFIDNAAALIEDRVARPSPGVLDRLLVMALKECNRVGLTGVHDAGTTRDVLESLRRLGARGALTLNVYSMLDSYDGTLCREHLKKGPSSEYDGRLVIRALKLRADGALGSRGAALLAPYNDDPGNVGLDVQAPDTLLAWTRAAVAAGFQVATHAIGDRGNRAALDAYERALAGKTGARLRIEHCQVLALDDIPRFQELGVIAAMQPTHATSDMPWAETRVGRDRLRGAYAWKTLLKRGAILAFGSDFPVESVDPMTGLYAAVTRQDADGKPPGGWRAEEALTLEEAVRGFTKGAAYAAFDEQEAGAIAAGMRADITVLDRDIVRDIRNHPRALLDTHAKYTIVRGKIVYERP